MKPTLGLIILLLLVVVSRAVHAQSEKLPSDLLLTTVGPYFPQTNSLFMQLMRVDAETLALRPFYSDPQAPYGALQALAWSPDGKWLAIYRALLPPVNRKEICILNRDGMLRNCLKDRPINDVSVQTSSLWSADGRFVYFVIEEAKHYKVVEVDVESGERVRVMIERLVERPAVDSTFPLYEPGMESAILLANDARSAKVAPLYPSQTNATPELDFGQTAKAELTVPAFCSRLSPKGTYLTARDMSDHDERALVVMNMQGQILHVVDHRVGRGQLSVNCPTWEPDLSAFYFVGHAETPPNAHLFKYSLATRLLTVLYRAPEQTQDNPLRGRLIPDRPLAIYGDFVAAEGYDNPNSAYEPQVVIIYPDGRSLSILGDYAYTQAPLWLPPAP